ncbi:MAG TPA: hypothetical protein PK816_11475 [Candidatus Cloacimonadota bacterium]|nr:hypothetical protein [Candidatus Cloacimonadota bacterium]
MKKLNKLEINPKKLMKNEELLVIRGGYGGILICSGGYVTCQFEVAGCDGAAELYCNNLCPGGWTSAICTGW